VEEITRLRCVLENLGFTRSLFVPTPLNRHPLDLRGTSNRWYTVLIARKAVCSRMPLGTSSKETRRGSNDSSSSKSTKESFRDSLADVGSRALDKFSSPFESMSGKSSDTSTFTLTQGASPKEFAGAMINGAPAGTTKSFAKSASPIGMGDENTNGPCNSTPSKYRAAKESAKISTDSEVDPVVTIKTQENNVLPGGPSTKHVGGSKTPTATPNQTSASVSPAEPAEHSRMSDSKQFSPDNSMSPPSLAKESVKQSRGSNTPIAKHEPQLYGDLPDVTEEATSTFEVINVCIYSSKWIGDSGQDSEAMSCECKEQFGGFRCFNESSGLKDY
jgi:hypothetical protein